MHRSDWRYNSSARAKPKKCVVYGCKVHSLLACFSFLFFLSSIPFWLFFVPSHLPFLGRQCRAGSRGFMAGDNFDLNGLSPERAAEPTRCVFCLSRTDGTARWRPCGGPGGISGSGHFPRGLSPVREEEYREGFIALSCTSFNLYSIQLYLDFYLLRFYFIYSTLLGILLYLFYFTWYSTLFILLYLVFSFIYSTT